MAYSDLEGIVLSGRNVNYDEFDRYVDNSFFEGVVVPRNSKVNTALKSQYQSYFSQGFEQVRGYLRRKGITDFRHVIQWVNSGKHSTFYNLSYGLGTITGLWKGSKSGPDVRKSLIDAKILSADLSTIADKEEIYRQACHYSMRSPPIDYFRSEVVGDMAAKNQAGFQASAFFRDWLRENNINLYDPSTVKTKKQRHVLETLAGIPLTGETRTKIREESPFYRKIVTVWTPEDEDALAAMLGEIDMGDRIKYLQGNREAVENQFGRTLFAIQLKAAHLGIVEYQNPWSDTPAFGREISYPMPHTPLIMENGGLGYLLNQHFLLERGIPLDGVDVFAFMSPAHEQFTHVVTPVPYRGIFLDSYPPYEQHVLATANAFAASPEKESKHLPGAHILRLSHNDQNYAGLLIRHSFATDPMSIRTTELPFGKRKEVLFWKENEEITFAQARAREYL